MTLYKYSGAGNDFVVLDGRHEDVSAYRDSAVIRALCDRKSGFRVSDGRVGADGLMILSPSEQYDFRMEFYNPDGSSGMMCGNGGRCMVAFADHAGVSPADTKTMVFEAADGLHSGEILSREGNVMSVRLGMTDAAEYHRALDGWFLNTGTRHFVKFVDDVEALDIAEEGRRYRWDAAFAPLGANANFASLCPDGSVMVRTFEKGVEAETLACGTGLTACAIASWLERKTSGVPVKVSLHARIADLEVQFLPPSSEGEAFREVYLTGPAELVCTGDAA